jgi:hypothetical protein
MVEWESRSGDKKTLAVCWLVYKGCGAVLEGSHLDSVGTCGVEEVDEKVASVAFSCSELSGEFSHGGSRVRAHAQCCNNSLKRPSGISP